MLFRVSYCYCRLDGQIRSSNRLNNWSTLDLIWSKKSKWKCNRKWLDKQVWMDIRYSLCRAAFWSIQRRKMRLATSRANSRRFRKKYKSDQKSSRKRNWKIGTSSQIFSNKSGTNRSRVLDYFHSSLQTSLSWLYDPTRCTTGCRSSTRMSRT